MAKDILYKTITADTQVSSLPCYLVGAELQSTTNAQMYIYDEADSTKTAAELVLTVKARSTNYLYDNCIFPEPGIKCKGLYADWEAGVGTIYYHF